ncbi:MAG: hypothetical protein WCF84_26755 [Anaerolineae bacterium]
MNEVKIGQIVEFVQEDGTHAAAIIAALGPDVSLGQVQLHVFAPDFGLRIVPSAFYAETHARGTWHRTA